jgi:hypothetical protein
MSRVDERRAEQRAKAQAAMERASADLARIQPARVANSDAKVLTRYLGALGLEVGPDRLNDLLVLLAVLMIEAGGGLSLAIGMALSGSAHPAPTNLERPAEGDTATTAVTATLTSVQPSTPPSAVLNAGAETAKAPPAPNLNTAAPALSIVGHDDVLTHLRAANGILRCQTAPKD